MPTIFAVALLTLAPYSAESRAEEGYLIPHGAYAEKSAGYYIDTRQCSTPEEQQKYCRPLLA